MKSHIPVTAILATCVAWAYTAQAVAAAAAPFVLGPPTTGGPVLVRIGFELRNINQIDDEAETFEFAGVLTTVWTDPRSAFDPAMAGVNEKIYQGDYQFNEIAPGWYPQVILVNEADVYDKRAVILRVLPDGTSTLMETIVANAKVKFNMRRFPFDRQRLQAVFQVLGFDQDQLVLEVESSKLGPSGSNIWVPQWTITQVDQVAERAAGSSALIVAVNVARDSFFVLRLVGIPLVVIVLLSFSVFWMDRSSLGDRIAVSFIGILTAVAYQFVMSDNLPRIAYFTLMHGFLNLSFLTMCATVVINLVVGAVDKRGNIELGDRIDRRCRWIFPMTYFGLIGVMVAVAFCFY